MDFQAWKQDVSDLLERFRQLDVGYPLDENSIAPPTDKTLLQRFQNKASFDEKSSLLGFYKECDGISLPDIHIGYFIHNLGLLINDLERYGNPVYISGSQTHRVVIFGSDGGGGFLGIDVDDGEVLHLSDGAIIDGRFDGELNPVKVLSPCFSNFLTQLKLDIENFMNETAGWKYLL